MSGTSINNNVIEAYPQLYLLYNASVNMLCIRIMFHTKTTATPCLTPPM
jgi:hypothetical protein